MHQGRREQEPPPLGRLKSGLHEHPGARGVGQAEPEHGQVVAGGVEPGPLPVDGADRPLGRSRSRLRAVMSARAKRQRRLERGGPRERRRLGLIEQPLGAVDGEAGRQAQAPEPPGAGAVRPQRRHQVESGEDVALGEGGEELGPSGSPSTASKTRARCCRSAASSRGAGTGGGRRTRSWFTRHSLRNARLPVPSTASVKSRVARLVTAPPSADQVNSACPVSRRAPARAPARCRHPSPVGGAAGWPSPALTRAGRPPRRPAVPGRPDAQWMVRPRRPGRERRAEAARRAVPRALSTMRGRDGRGRRGGPPAARSRRSGRGRLAAHAYERAVTPGRTGRLLHRLVHLDRDVPPRGAPAGGPFLSGAGGLPGGSRTPDLLVRSHGVPGRPAGCPPASRAVPPLPAPIVPPVVPPRASRGPQPGRRQAAEVSVRADPSP